MLGQIMNMAERAGVLSESDFMTLSEKEVMEKLDTMITVVACSRSECIETTRLARLYRTFRTMTKIEHTKEPLPESDYFCVNLKVKQRYINPLVMVPGAAEVSIRPSDYSSTGKALRLSDISEKARRISEDFKSYSDTPYGCARFV